MDSQTKEHQAPKSHGLRFWPVWILAIPLLYVLSVGPASNLTVRGLISSTTFDAIYAPLTSFCFVHPVAHRCYCSYLKLWGVNIYYVYGSLPP